MWFSLGLQNLFLREVLMSNSNVKLRALEPEDITCLYRWENDIDISEVSYTSIPYSKYILGKYIEHAQMDIQESGQCRFMIENELGQTVGCVDLYDYHAIHSRAGIGILIDRDHRGNGYASSALSLIIEYAFNSLGLRQVYCSISVDNEMSISLFEKADFSLIGRRQDWRFSKGKFIDVYEYQLLNSK